jgi:hypothetical protein
MSDFDTWKDRAAQVTEVAVPASIPLHVVFGEAVDVARFFAKYWGTVRDPASNAVTRLGLDSAAGPKTRIAAQTGDEILSLQRAGQEAQTRYLLTVDPAIAAPRERGKFLLEEITAVLEWYFDDGVHDENDDKLAALGAAHAGDPGSMDALASALDDYAALAEPHRAALDGLGGFQAAYLDEASKVSSALREAPQVPIVMSEAAREAIKLRNQMVSLLWERVSSVRAAAKFVYRDHPEIVREATSVYERRKRAATRRAAARAERAAAEKAAAEKAAAEKAAAERAAAGTKPGSG